MFYGEVYTKLIYIKERLNLSEEYWGQGLIQETIQLIINYLFNEEEIDCIICSHFIHNIQSEKAIKKCGFKFYLEDDNEKYYCLTKNTMD